MTEPKPAAETAPDLDQGGTAAAGGEAAPAAPEQLTPAEQMALFEQELKENDWGHQPC